MAAVANVVINVDSSNAAAKLRQFQQQSSATARAAEELQKGATAAANAATKVGREYQTAANGLRYFIDAAGRARAENGRFLSTAERTAAGIRNQGQALNGLTGILGRFAAGAFALQAAKLIFVKTAEIESQAKSLEVLTGSAQKSKQIISELQQLGAVTPFTSTELIDAAKRLQAFGVETNKVVETTRRLADVSGATGAELQGLVTAYGQVQAKGRLQGEELLQFQERGIGLQKELQRMYGMSGEEFRKALEKGKISAQAVEVAIKNLTNAGGKYANGAIAQSSTLQGKFSTLQDGVDALARELGNTLAPAVKKVLDDITALINGFVQGLQYMQAEYRKFLANLRGKTVDELQGQIGQLNKFIEVQQGYLKRAEGGSRTEKQIQQKIVEFRNLRDSLQKDLDQKLGLVAPQGRPATLPAAQPGAGKPPALLGETGGAGADQAANAAKKLQEELKRSVEQGDRLGREYSRQVLQLSVIGEAEQERNRIQAAYEDRALDIKDLRNAEQRANLTALNNEIRRLELQKLQTDELKKQAAEYIKLIPIFSQFNQDLGALAFKGGPLGAGIGGNVGVAFGGTSLIGPSQNEELTKAKEALTALLDPINQVKTVATGIGGAFSDSFRAVVTGSMTAQEALASFFSRIADSFLEMAGQIIAQMIVIKSLESAISIFGGGLGGGFKGFSGAGPVAFPSNMNIGLAGFRAAGGPVSGNQSYMVGERGPELFVPGRSGTIVPNNALGSGGSTSVVVNVDASGSNVQGDGAQAGQLGKAIGIAVQQELIKQKRPGGLLAGV